jgi:hypothetical protein
LTEEVRIEGIEGLGLQHLYRAMDFLEANKEVLKEAIYFRIADLLNLNLDVELNRPRRRSGSTHRPMTQPTNRSLHSYTNFDNPVSHFH